MPAFTTRLGLYKPGGGSTGLITPDEIIDIDKLNSNSDKIDASIGAQIVTSTTRPGSPYDGQIARESDTNNLIVWNAAGNNWAPVGVPYCANQATRDAFYPNPKQGNTCVRADMGWTEQYFELYNSSTNKSGAAVAGWYPVAGKLPRIRLQPLQGGINGIIGSQYCLSKSGFSLPLGTDYNTGFAYDTATGKLTPSVVGRFRVKSFICQNGGSGVSLKIAASLNSTTDPTSSPAGPAEAVNGCFAYTEAGTFSGIQSWAILDGEISTTAVTDFFQFWMSSGAGTTSITGHGASGGVNPYQQSFGIEYVGPPVAR